MTQQIKTILNAISASIKGKNTIDTSVNLKEILKLRKNLEESNQNNINFFSEIVRRFIRHQIIKNSLKRKISE